MNTQTILHNTDTAIRRQLSSLTLQREDYWSFRGKATREHNHGYLKYPAMMVPQMQRMLIESVISSQPSIKKVFDPFVGSGTILTESMALGLDFSGVDINPLAILSCKVKSGRFDGEKVYQQSVQLLNRINLDTTTRIEVDFQGLNKWFKPNVIIDLSKIRRAIRKEPRLWIRRFFWLAFAEAIRLSSNSRTSTFKLHIRSLEDMSTRKISPLKLFKSILESNVAKHASLEKILLNKKLLSSKRYIGEINITLGDSIKLPKTRKGKYDLLVTSPPYGDNSTTVPYGQYSYLPLQWIDLEDIDIKINQNYLSTASEIDRLSLGGSRAKIDICNNALYDISPSLKEFSNKVGKKELVKKVLAFSRDLYLSLAPLTMRMKKNSYMLWTLGNRRVGGETVHLDTILEDFLSFKNISFVEKLTRTIPSKTMASKNKTTLTMTEETVLLMRKND